MKEPLSNLHLLPGLSSDERQNQGTREVWMVWRDFRNRPWRLLPKAAPSSDDFVAKSE